MRWDKERMFFLTRVEQVEVSSMEEVFNCGNQCLLDPNNKDLEFDRFGRNYLDRQFVLLCMTIWAWKTILPFKSLFCRKDGERYVARLELSDETLEMVESLEKRCRGVAEEKTS